MNVGQAKRIARQWVREEAGSIPGFSGAFLHGSVMWLSDGVTLSETSDIDVMVVVNTPDPPAKPGKTRFQHGLLDVSLISVDDARTPEQVLSLYNLAGSFRTPGILADPTGRLNALQSAVARDYAKRAWVTRRRDHARDKVLHAYGVNEAAPFHDQVIGWLFPTGILTHILLVAGLQNPTVRRRYLSVQKLLEDYGQRDMHEYLLELLGCASISRSRVDEHVATLAEAFDAATEVIRTPFPFASDISAIARPIAIEGSQELIAQGDHREAVFWMVATYSRCQTVLFHDGSPAMYNRFEAGYRALLSDLGIVSSSDLQRQSDDVKAALPAVVDLSSAIIAANPAIDV